MKIHLGRASLQQQDHRRIQNHLYEQQHAQIASRRSLNSGGPLEIEQACEIKQLKAEKQHDEAVRKTQKAIDDWVKKAEKALNRRGIDSRHAERERKKKLAELQASGAFIPIDLYEAIRDPEKNSTPDVRQSRWCVL